MIDGVLEMMLGALCYLAFVEFVFLVVGLAFELRCFIILVFDGFRCFVSGIFLCLAFLMNRILLCFVVVCWCCCSIVQVVVCLFLIDCVIVVVVLVVVL